MANLPGKAWMDGDGKHVWFEHQCADGMCRSMLPWSQWRNEKGVVTPSIDCRVPNCGFHSSPLIGEPPFDWEPRKTREELNASASTDGGGA